MKKYDAYLLDTDIIIYWPKNKYPQINEMIISIRMDRISVAELYFGAYNSTRKEENKQLVDDLMEKMNILNFDENAAKCFGEIKSSLKKQGKIICDSDLFITACAISNDLILVTNNEKHFQRVEKLKVENWAA